MNKGLIAAVAAAVGFLPFAALAEDPPELTVSNTTSYPVHVEVDGHACDLKAAAPKGSEDDVGDCNYGPDVEDCKAISDLGSADICVQLDLSAPDHTVVVTVNGVKLTKTAHLSRNQEGNMTAACFISTATDNALTLICA
ncbi:MAG: hypothetical protein ACM3ZT_06290 [Bacillota bacterium]